MTAIPIGELAHHAARAKALVESGETVDIIERGEVVARIVPVDPTHDRRVRSAAVGHRRPAFGGRPDLLTEVRRRIANEPIDAGRVNAALRELRDGERY
ncbi:hypothetical protein IU433_18075 [Nocardia puris]|uniref:Antitoxin (DNA-binding transcriptional repressor) of toxin-antitoxin stability system n=1 Tax=Nocardia puris TaxID=208602 RepID=A0A366D6C9_9NOCA|nr:hypothetical protein [Nocardia puris]MBF6212352.1 hypothetical protein [Nocardia puris]MBF6366599.1 hypothetical protein [Nocardia puris]MBF6460941.1 hypothetical protein [Nocardia puris]RBO85590.1 antitoxin (DNA-binding transcriptional repressor) of toxin-antitoxin stability system [Nocardia puris]